MSTLESSLLELLRRAAVELTPDLVGTIDRAYSAEDPHSNGHAALEVIRESIAIARSESLPVSQDTSSIHFYLRTPHKFDTHAFEQTARTALRAASRDGYLTTPFEDPVTGKPPKGSRGAGEPVFHVVPETRKSIEVRLLLRSHREEMAGSQFVLPDEGIGAACDLRGARRAALNALLHAHRIGAGPSVLGIAIGGDRASGLALAREQLLRPLNDHNPSLALRRLEKQLLKDANTLGIGPVGVGGKVSLLGAKVAAAPSPRHSWFVSVACSGWACRRQGVELTVRGSPRRWLYGSADAATTTASSSARRKAAPEAKTGKATAKSPGKAASKTAGKATAKTAGKPTAKTASKATARNPSKAPSKSPAKAAAKTAKNVSKKPAKKATKKPGKKKTKS